jgi:hypothetical protein
MNTLFNVRKTVLMLFAALSIAACNSKQTSGDVANGMEHGDSTHVHTYACPMHPDVQGQEGDKCSKCGMPLEHMDHAPMAGNFKMEFKASAEKIEAGKSVNLSFTPKNKDNANAAVPLDVEHEKKIHLILVSEDLSWFDHIHPEYQADGSYMVGETFPNGGKYILYADYKPTGGMHQLEKIEVQVEGKQTSPKTFSSAKTTASSGDYAVTLKPDDAVFKSHEGIHFDGLVTKKGKAFDVNDFQSYLGAKGHMVGIHQQSKAYVHLHPEVENGKLHFHTTFPEAGMYRVWLQFMAEDKLHTVDFTLSVEKGKESNTMDEHKEDDHSDHKH